MKQFRVVNKIKNTKKYKCYTRDMRIGDVKRYFKTLINSRRKAKCKSADYCWRCGRFLARDRIFEKGQNYMGFNLCPECYEYKTSSKTESVPDIEDIKRFGLSFNF